MPSKGALNRQRIGKDLVAATRTHAKQVGLRFRDALVAGGADSATIPDIEAFYHQLADYLEAKMDAVIVTDEAYLEEVDDDTDPRIRRREATDALYQKVIEMREALGGLYGFERSNAVLGITGRTPRDFLTLHRVTNRMLERLRKPDPLVPLPTLRLQGFQVDPSALAAELEPFADELGQAIADVDRERRETETTKEARDQAFDAFDIAASGVGRIVIGCNDVAGFSYYADKIRLTLPTRGSRSQAEEDEIEVPPSEGEPGEESTPPIGFEPSDPGPESGVTPPSAPGIPVTD